MLLPSKYSFRFLNGEVHNEVSMGEAASSVPSPELENPAHEGVSDESRRNFLKLAGIAGVGIVASQLLPEKASALVLGSSPTTGVVGVKNASNARVNPATEDTLATLIAGQGVNKLTISLSSSGTVRTPASGKKIRVYASRFSLTADATSVSFRFTSGGTDHERYVSPKAGGLYGSNNHPNYIEGGVDQVLYCAISGTTTVQINIDYLEV
jgi:galactokinase/mevalonate kinase-like predicted kinase